MHYGVNPPSNFQQQQQQLSESTSYDAYPAVSVYTSAQQAYYNAANYLYDPAKCQGRPEQRYTPGGSPSPSTSQTFDHPPSTLSSASGASVQSTASSAVGSPYSHAKHTLPGQDQWSSAQHGLGLAPEIVHNDGFGHESIYPLSGLDNDIMFDDDKLQASCVGESRRISSSSASSQPFSSISSCSTSQPLTLAMSPPPAIEPFPCRRDLTIDTILEEANSQIAPSSRNVSPSSTNSRKPSPELARHTNPYSSPPLQSGSFRSPTTPASAMSSPTASTKFPPVQQQTMYRRRLVAASGERRRHRASASPTDRFTPYSMPLPHTAQNLSPSLQTSSSFFSQSSGRFIPPLESSCWFSLDALAFAVFLYLLFNLLPISKIHRRVYSKFY